jgi:hypothetical protein
MTSMKVIDLRGGAQDVRRKPYDYCVIGAGAIGLYVAARLADRGAAVVIVERGGTRPGPPPDQREIEFGASPYSAATNGRDCGFGGTTSRWGGLLVPHIDADTRGSRDWGHIVSTVRARSSAVLSALGWRHGHDGENQWFGSPRLGEAAALGGEVIALRSLYLPFRRKNLRWLIEGRKIDVFVHAVAAEWKVRRSDPAAVESIVIRAQDGAERVLTAGRFVVAAGAIESTRCALEIASLLPNRCLPVDATIGFGLSDHLSIPIGKFEGPGAEWASNRLGFWWEHGWMRGCRMAGCDESRFPVRSFIHPVFHSDGPGFRMVREALRAIQARRRPRLRASDVIRAAPALSRYAIERLRNRVHHEPDTTCVMQLDVEQVPDRSNHVELVQGTQDWSGRPRIRVSWSISDADRRSIAISARAYQDAWSSTPGLPEWRPLIEQVSQQRPHDAYHPVGTCRMGLDDGVVDGNLRLRGLSNVWIASTAVLPSAGSANPTFSTMCLADEAVRDMVASHQ